MKIGAMNNPQMELLEEIDFIKDEFDFIDLTIEPGCYEEIDVKKVKKKLKGMHVIGHTAWSLPIASPFREVRKAALKEFVSMLDIFEALDVRLINIHPHMPKDVAEPDAIVSNNIAFFKKAVKQADKRDMTLMMENTKQLFNQIDIIQDILDAVPQLMLHWDVGHANLGNEGEKKTHLVFEQFKDRIKHIHFSDNMGLEDQHLPLGAGNINWPFIIKIMQEHGYKETVTLEIHTPDRSYLLFSRDKVKFMLKKLKEEK